MALALCRTTQNKFLRLIAGQSLLTSERCNSAKTPELEIFRRKNAAHWPRASNERTGKRTILFKTCASTIPRSRCRGHRALPDRRLLQSPAVFSFVPDGLYLLARNSFGRVRRSDDTPPRWRDVGIRHPTSPRIGDSNFSRHRAPVSAHTLRYPRFVFVGAPRGSGAR